MTSGALDLRPGARAFARSAPAELGRAIQPARSIASSTIVEIAARPDRFPPVPLCFAQSGSVVAVRLGTEPKAR